MQIFSYFLISVSPQATSAGSSQSAVTAVHGGMSQYLPQAKPMFSVFGEGGPEVKMPPRKNEDRWALDHFNHNNNALR